MHWTSKGSIKFLHFSELNSESRSVPMFLTYRMTFMGLITGFYFVANLLWGGLYIKVVKKQKKLALRNQAKENGQEANSQGNGHANINIATKDDTDKESTI